MVETDKMEAAETGLTVVVEVMVELVEMVEMDNRVE